MRGLQFEREHEGRKAMTLLRKAPTSFKGFIVSGLRDIAENARLFCKETSGATAIMVALMLPVVVLGMGLGAETGYHYMKQRKVQHAADLAAIAGAARLRAGDSLAAITAAVTHVAIEGGYDPAIGTIRVNTPPLSGAAAGESGSIEVILTHTEPRFFSLLAIKDPVRIGGRAVARVTTSNSTACVLALSPTAPAALTISGSTSVDLSGCGVASNSNADNALSMSGTSAQLSADCAQTVGKAVVTSQLNLTGCPEVREFAPVVRDPYANVAEPARVGGCQGGNGNVGHPNSTTILTPSDNHPSGVKSMRFCQGINLRGKVKFGPGLYIIEGGDFGVHSAADGSSAAPGVDAGGVTFFLAGSSRLILNGNADLALAAPSSGPFAGLVFFASRSQTSITHRVAGTSGSTFHGAIYAPASTIEMTGNSRSKEGCTHVIGNRVIFSGNSSLQSECSGAGVKDIIMNETIAIVE